MISSTTLLYLIVNSTHVLISNSRQFQSGGNELENESLNSTLFPVNEENIVKNTIESKDEYSEIENTAASQPAPQQQTMDCECGMAEKRTRMIDGSRVWLADFPWLVGFVPKMGEGENPDKMPVPFCYGSLISSRHVLAAANCLNRAKSDDTEAVFLGSRVKGVRRRRQLSQILIHDGYNRSTYANDLALVTLQESVLRERDKDMGIITVCLPPMKSRRKYLQEKTTIAIRQDYRTIFYGQLNYYFGVLEPRIIRTGMGKCPDLFVERLQSKNLCEHENAISYSNYCYADPGIPLMLHHTEKKRSGGKYSLLGVFSTGYGCKGYTGERPADVATDISGYMPWILENSSEVCSA